MTTATTSNIDELASKLKARLAALGDGGDARSDNERSAYRRDYDSIQRTISGLMNAPSDLAREDTRLDDLTTQRAAVIAKRQEIADALADAPDWRKFDNARERDRAFDHEQHLREQGQLLADGQLLASPGVSYPRLDFLDARIKEQTTRRDRCQRALDGFLQQAEQLLAEP